MPPASTTAAISYWQIAYYVAMFALTVYGLTRPQPKVPDATVQTGDGPTAQEGRPIPVVFGTVIIRDPNFYYFGGLKTKPIKTKSPGKK